MVARPTTDPTESDQNLVLRRRRAVRSAYAGFFIDSFDIYLPSVALLPAMMYFSSGLSSDAARLVTGFTFASTLLGRPLGAVIFGHLSDRLGRRRTGSISIFGFAVCTLLIGCLPGSAQIGAGAAITLLIALRFVDGIFLGGEYTAATPLAIEHTSPHRRGIIGGAIQSSSTTGYVAIAVFTYIALHVAPAGSIHSGYVQWGWRIPFFAGAIIAAGVGLFLRRRVEESEVWLKAELAKAPLRDAFTGSSRTAFAQVFIVMTGIFFGTNMLGSLMPQLLAAHKGFSANRVTLTIIFCNILVPFFYVIGGWMADRYGRKPAIIVSGVVMAVVQGAALAMMGSMRYTNWTALIVTAFFVAAATVMAVGIMPAWINELFPTRARSSGWGIGYSSATIIPGLFVFYQTGLLGWMPYNYTPAVLAFLGGVLVVIGGIMAKETRGTDLAAVESGDTQAAGPPARELPVT
ncbi:MFS transporter [Actinoallomurus acaciae]|uniref:MFS transporter n=1 Tax=Actinoallomurus acaciae TaxID=502577 RepID=A0ABV5YCK1_9ACTN